MTGLEDPADILNDALAFLGGSKVVEDEIIKYGDLQLTVAAKVTRMQVDFTYLLLIWMSQEGKANTLLADHLFSPGLFLAERIERGLIPVHNLNVIEFGAGCALPSLLMSTLAAPPATIVVTDYPDPGILGNLVRNVERNSHLVSPRCTVRCGGYEWGTDVTPLLAYPGIAGHGYDLVVLSDLLHFHSSHAVLISSVEALLAHSPAARVHVAAGNYTKPDVCDNFLHEEREWLGGSSVSGLDRLALAARKGACRYWVGRRGTV
ncbi:hypothetical protein FB451DRAFT_1352434 [Mycena latifolia]|nr:hypothetical protein FB451DRAFT_1352434 [Mycena latifolia]